MCVQIISWCCNCVFLLTSQNASENPYKYFKVNHVAGRTEMLPQFSVETIVVQVHKIITVKLHSQF